MEKRNVNVEGPVAPECVEAEPTRVDRLLQALSALLALTLTPSHRLMIMSGLTPPVKPETPATSVKPFVPPNAGAPLNGPELRDSGVPPNRTPNRRDRTTRGK